MSGKQKQGVRKKIDTEPPRNSTSLFGNEVLALRAQ